MKRLSALLLTTLGVIGLGCGYNSYETRLTKTAQVIKDQIQLDHYLNPPVTGKFQEFGFFLRPPKPLAPAKQFQLTDLTSGQFLGQYDVDGSFLDLGKNEKGDAPKLSLHFLGRRKLAKKADPKKKTTAPSPAETAQRGPFVQDVQGLLGFVFGNAAQGATKDYSKGTNKYKRQIFPATEKTNIRVYYLAEKAGADTYDAALIWEVPNPPVQAMEKGIDLTLGSFAAGAKATRAFQGDTPAEDAPGEGGEAPAGPSAPF